MKKLLYEDFFPLVYIQNWTKRNIPNEEHHEGMVSIKVGFEWVNKGFMYFVSNPDHALAATDLPAGVFPGGIGASLDIALKLFLN